MQGSLNNIEEWGRIPRAREIYKLIKVTYMIEKGVSKRAEKMSQKEDKMYPGK